jgi:hypothetical protein
MFKISNGKTVGVFFNNKKTPTKKKIEIFLISDRFIEARFDEIRIPKGFEIIDTSIDYSRIKNGELEHISRVTIPDGIRTISSCAFMRTGITEVVIPASVKVIGQWAFASCHNLKKVTFMGVPDEIGMGAFADCPNLVETVSQT